MTIVCATHFSISSSDAVVVAAHLARRMKQKLWLVTVVPGVPLSTGRTSHRDKTVLDALHTEANLLRQEGLDVEVSLLHGKVDRALGKLCHDIDARLLVVGDSSQARTSPFATPVDRIAFGVSVPLLVVHSMKPFEAWARGERPLKVLLAIDQTWSSAVARDWLAGLAAYGPLDLLATHLWLPAEEHARRHGKTPMTPADEGAMAEELTTEAEGALRSLPPNVKWRVQLEVGRGNLGELLLEMAAREQVDVMVLGTHQRKGLLSRLTSTSHQVLADAIMSVALVPSEPVEPKRERRPPEQPRH